MTPHYEPAEIIAIGRAQDVILGGSKGLAFDDSPFQSLRATPVEDDEKLNES